jgi:hypothetical protein
MEGGACLAANLVNFPHAPGHPQLDSCFSQCSWHLLPVEISSLCSQLICMSDWLLYVRMAPGTDWQGSCALASTHLTSCCSGIAESAHGSAIITCSYYF